MNHTKGGSNTKNHLAVDVHGMPIRVIITKGFQADCTIAGRLIQGINAERLLSDRGYDSDAIIEEAKSQGIAPEIPPKRNRKVQKEYDKHLYK